MNNSKTKVDLDVDFGKLKTVPINLKKIGDIVIKEVVKNAKFSTLKTKVNELDKKIPDTTTLIRINQYNTDKQNLQKKIRDVEKKSTRRCVSVTTTVLNTKVSEVEDTSSLVATTVPNTKIGEVRDKIPNHDAYITTQEFNKLRAENFKERLKQADLVSKNDFDKKIISFNKKIPQIKQNI